MASKPIRRGRRKAFAALAFVGVALAPVAANADSIFDLFAPEANPYVVQNNIARAGLVPRSALVRRGDVYLCDVSDRNGLMQRLIIDSRTGRILERYALRPSAWEEARRPDARPRLDSREWGLAPVPEVDVPVAQPKVIEAFPGDPPQEFPRAQHSRDLAYGDGHMATPTPDPKPIDRPKLKITHPKHAPAPAASNLPETATVAPSASDPAVQSPAPQAAPPVLQSPAAAPAPMPVTPTLQQPAAAQAPAPPVTSGAVVSSAAAEAPATKAQTSPAPAAKTKAINDIPVAPLD